MRKRNTLLAMAALAVFLLLPAAAQADPVTLVLDPTHNVAAGGSVTFFGSLTNGGAPPRSVSSASVNILGPAGITWDVTAIFLYPTPIDGSVGAFFDVFADLTVPPGIYSGTFTVQLLDDNEANLITLTQEFTVVVTGAAVPEPATMALLGTGLAGFAAWRRKRRQTKET